jgi:ATPase complex subunit ATP10
MHFGSLTDIRVQLKMRNALVGWVYLIDSHGRVRWTAHGEATPTEIESMLRLTESLLK